MTKDATSSLRRFAVMAVTAAGSLAAVVGGAVFFGWLAGIMQPMPASARPKTNMALAQFLAGAALLALGLPAVTRWRKWAGVAAAAVVLLIGALTLGEHAFGWNLHIDELFAQEPPGAGGTISSNRMGPPGSASLTLVGAGLLSLAFFRRGPAPYLGLAICLISLVPAVGFLYGITQFYDEPEWTGISWPTVVVLLALGGGLIVASRDYGPMVLLLRDDAGGRMVRQMLPVALILPLGLGLVLTYGERIGLYDLMTGRGLLIISLTLLLTWFLWRTAARLSAADREQRDTQEVLRQLNHTLEQRIAQRTAEVRQRSARLQSLAGDLTRTEERERRRLAQLLHDGLQQLLVASNMQLTLAHGGSTEPQVKEAIAAARELIDESIRESRTLTLELSPPVLYDAGLEPALQWLCRWMLDKHKLHVTIANGSGVEPRGEETAVILFQSVREALFNVVKHAAVDQAEVVLGLSGNGRLQIVVTDAGCGFDPTVEPAHDNDSFGLFAIRERLALIGGEMTIHSRRGEGTRVTLVAPARAAEPDTRGTAASRPA